MVTRVEAIRALKDDPVRFFNSQCKLISKAGQETYFRLNETQTILYAKCQEQLKTKGKIRIVVLKGRQQGVTTFSRMLGAHRTLYNKGIKTRLMTHTHDASKALFGLIRQCYGDIHPQLKPTATKNNESVLEFDSIRSGMSIATAGAKGTGRSATLQFFIGSEIGFWDNAADHTRGMMQALSGEAGSVCILESTANGMTGDAEEFYNKFMGGLEGDGDFESLFIPWFTNAEYSTTPPSDFTLKTYPDYCEKQYKEKNNLTDAQIYWMRQKIHTDFNKRYSMFCIEYPSHPQEAFEGTGELSFIEPRIVVEARKREADPQGNITLGVDVGGDSFSSDRSVIALRAKDSFTIIWEQKGIERDALLQVIADYVKQYKPHKIRIDITGIGYNLDKDVIKLCNMRNIPIADCLGVNFGENAVQSDKFVNQRAEMYHHLREALIVGSCDDRADIQKHLTALSYKRDKNRRLQMEAKKNLTESPDYADAMALCCHQSRNQLMGIIC